MMDGRKGGGWGGGWGGRLDLKLKDLCARALETLPDCEIDHVGLRRNQCSATNNLNTYILLCVQCMADQSRGLRRVTTIT